MKYGQFCPIAKATEVLGERWMLLIIRELLLGSTRFNELQRALPLISPSLLTKRLKELQEGGLLIKQTVRGQRSTEYHLTPEGAGIYPIIEALADWGMRWVRSSLDEEDLDIELLMWDIHRNIDTDQLPGAHAVLRFNFKGLDKMNDWWLVVNKQEVDLCTKNPWRDVDLHIVSELRTLVDVWMGNTSIQQARASDKLNLVGNTEFSKRFSKWFALSPLANA